MTAEKSTEFFFSSIEVNEKSRKEDFVSFIGNTFNLTEEQI